MKKYEEKYEEKKSSLRLDLGDNVPDIDDWQCARNLVKFLKNFYDMTLRVSGSHYVTSNSFFSEIADLLYILND